MNARLFRQIITILVTCLLAVPALAVELKDGEKYSVRYIIDGDTLILDNDEHVRLIGINAPEVENDKHSGQPMGKEASDYLRNRLEGHLVTLKTNKISPQDRYKRWLADVYDENGEWIQAGMLKSGYAVAYIFADGVANAAPLLAAEKSAIDKKTGIWSNQFHAILPADKPENVDNRFHVVSGVIKNVAKVKGNIYLNFGDDWKNDFTIFIPKENVADFKSAYGELKSLKNRKIITRGWVFERNGPMVELTVPELLQIIE